MTDDKEIKENDDPVVAIKQSLGDADDDLQGADDELTEDLIEVMQQATDSDGGGDSAKPQASQNQNNNQDPQSSDDTNVSDDTS